MGNPLEQMNIEDQVAFAVEEGLEAVLDLAEGLGEKEFVVYDILSVNHLEMYEEVKTWFEDYQ